MDWMLILATFMNISLVMMIVQALKFYVMPVLKQKYAWALPLLAVLAGPAVTAFTGWMSALIGHPIDFTEVIGVLTGVGSVAVYTATRAAYKKVQLRMVA